MEVSNDGVHFEEAATGTWDANAAWKLASFEPVCAKYVRLTSLDALSVEADNDYASAAEIRLTGTKTENLRLPKRIRSLWELRLRIRKM